MPLNIKPSTSLERKLLVVESILNTTDKISKISDEAILSGVAEGVSKISAKAEKDIILAASRLFPDTSFGDGLDQVARDFGISIRFLALGSSTYVRISATPGTQYLVNTHVFQSTSGIQFRLTSDVLIPSFGFTYAKVQSIQSGANTNVDPLSISQVSPQPNGHLNVINEYRADGGRDVESDEAFRIRIKDGANILARGTLAMLEQAFLRINPNILRIYNQGNNISGQIVIAIATQNGADLSETELDELLTGAADYFTFNELRPFGSKFRGISLVPIQYGFIDMSFRCKLSADADPDEVRKAAQINTSKYVDPRFFDSANSSVQWDNLLEIVKNVPGIENVPDQYFYPRSDIYFGPNVIPRMRGFLMLDLNGNIITNFQGTLSPVFYPNQVDFSFQSTVLKSIF